MYVLIVFMGFRLLVPFMGFKKPGLPVVIPKEIKNIITELEISSSSPDQYLRAVYNLVLNKTLHQWKHNRFQAVLRLPRLFVRDLHDIWRTEDFIYCTGINYVMFIMLSNSSFFKPEDIEFRHVFVNFVVHQYLKVKVGDNWVAVDPAGTGIRGKPLGSHLVFFG